MRVIDGQNVNKTHRFIPNSDKYTRGLEMRSVCWSNVKYRTSGSSMSMHADTSQQFVLASQIEGQASLAVARARIRVHYS